MTTAQTDLDVTARLRTMKFGYTSGMYPVPVGLPAEEIPLWHLRRAAELGCTMLQLVETPPDAQVRSAVREEAAELGLTLEGNARGLFVPLDTDAGAHADALHDQLEAAKETGMLVVRGGYGRLTLDTTRYAAERNAAAQLAHVTECLRAAVPIAADVGLPVAIENHCDFTGREVAQVLRDVDSDWVGCALDTANGFTVFCDPNDDIEALAEFTFTTHMKDMRMAPTPLRGTIPILPRGCRLGEGHVDFRRAVLLLAERSPRAEGLHLVVEAGWETFDPDADNAEELKQSLLEHGVGYLRELVSSIVEQG